MLAVILAILAVIFSLVYRATRPYKSWKATQEIPCPPCLPVIGNVHLIPVDGAGKWNTLFLIAAYRHRLLG